MTSQDTGRAGAGAGHTLPQHTGSGAGGTLPQHTGSGAGGTLPQHMVERALAAAKCDDCVVIADEMSTANLRWAGNTLTTNGVSRSRQLTVIAISRRAEIGRASCRGRV